MKLSKLQKATLAQLARRAYEHLIGMGAELPTFDEWRRGEVFQASGCYGLTEADNRHFNAIAARFESVLGNDDRALNHLMREQTEQRRQLESCLLRALASGGLSQTYAERIAQGRFACSVQDTNDQQLKQLVITVKNRVRAKRVKEVAV